MRRPEGLPTNTPEVEIPRARRDGVRIVTSFTRRDSSIYSNDLLPPSEMALLPHSDVIPSNASRLVTGPVVAWELTELDRT